MEFLPFLCKELKLSVLAVKGYMAAIDHVFSLAGLDLAANHVISKMFRCFEVSCPPREVWPQDWNLSLDLQSLTPLSYGPFKLSSCVSCLLLRRPNELVSYMAFFLCSAFVRLEVLRFLVVKTQNPSVLDPRFMEFTVPPLDDLVDGD